MGERDGFKPRPAEEKFVTGSRGGTPENAKESVLPVRVGEQKPSAEVTADVEQVARQMAVQVENLARFCEREHIDSDYGANRIPDDLNIASAWDRREGDNKPYLEVTSYDDPIQGVVGGWLVDAAAGGWVRTNRMELSIGTGFWDEELKPLVPFFGFMPSAKLKLPWHFDEPTLKAAITYRQTTPGLFDHFSTTYYFDKEGHLAKESIFPSAIPDPDNRPDIYGLHHSIYLAGYLKGVISPIAEWDLAVAPAAVTMLEKKIRNLRLRET